MREKEIRRVVFREEVFRRLVSIEGIIIIIKKVIFLGNNQESSIA